MKGHVGKILKINLTSGKIETVPTRKYEEWVGGKGMGMAVFWDEIDKDYLAKAAEVSGFEPENIVCMFPGVLGGTLAPNGGRTETCGVGPHCYPRPMFTRSNFGGRWGAMLKFAGYDGLVIKGKADKPVWVDIRDDLVRIRDADGIWGLGTYEAQEEIWRRVNSQGSGDWIHTGDIRKGARTTQRPAVVTIGQAGEHLNRIASLVHDVGCGSGQGGFGGVLGSKNLKAISVIGTGHVEVADPRQLLEARKWLRENYAFDIEKGEKTTLYRGLGNTPGFGTIVQTGDYTIERFGRPLGCYGCLLQCRGNIRASERYPGGEGQCYEASFYNGQDKKRHGKSTFASHLATQLLQDYGLNAVELSGGLGWLESLYARGLLGKGKQIHTDLDFENVGSEEFLEDFLKRIAYREEIGDVLADGCVRAAAKWGVLEGDLLSGIFKFVYNAGDVHHGDCLHWLYHSMFDSRDVNNHALVDVLGQKQVYSKIAAALGVDPNTPGLEPAVSAQQMADRFAELAAPWNDPRMLCQGENDAYSIHMARCVAWHTRHTNFYNNSALFCCWFGPSWWNIRQPEMRGASPEMETRFLSAVTGRDFSWEDGLELGRRIWNFTRAILVLQGKHRDEEYAPPYPPYNSYIHSEEPPYLTTQIYPVYDESSGKYKWETGNFPLRKDKVDEFKTIYYELEGWDKKTGWPTRETLDECGLGHVANELATRGRLP